MSSPVADLESTCPTWIGAKAFYIAMLATKIDKLSEPEPGVSEMMTFPMDQNGSGCTGALVTMKDGPSPGSGVMIYFASEDCAIEAMRVGSFGGK